MHKIKPQGLQPQRQNSRNKAVISCLTERRGGQCGLLEQEKRERGAAEADAHAARMTLMTQRLRQIQSKIAREEDKQDEEEFIDWTTAATTTTTRQ